MIKWIDDCRTLAVKDSYRSWTTNPRHIFSEWKTTTEGHQYPSHVVGFRFANRSAGMLNEKQWYQTDILEPTPLTELPTKLKAAH